MKAKLEHRLRLYSGLFIAFFLVLHLLNAGLGILSLSVMDKFGEILFGFWSIPLFSVLLYAAFAVHIGLTFVSLYRRNTLRMPIWNYVQIALGLILPWLLVSHVLGTRGVDIFLDVQRNYTQVVTGLWRDWGNILQQFALVLIAWTHMSVGIHFWLRHKRHYWKWVPLLYPLCLIVPLLALLGFTRAGIESAQVQSDTATLTYSYAPKNPSLPAQREQLQNWGNQALDVFGFMLIALLAYCLVRSQLNRKRGGFSIIHTSFAKTIKGSRGQSVLEALREARIPHAAVCGGRGRCTTCRVRITQSTSDLEDPAPLEANALRRVGAEPNVRLACQIRPERAVTITPLLKPSSTAQEASLPTGVVGREQQVVCMFVDMRGSTKLAEQKLPFDVVFILNQFFSQLSDVLRTTNGHYASFTGDGLMALYGLNTDLESACCSAITGAAEIQQRIESLNDWLAEELTRPIQVGIGIHCGEAIVGTMGPPETPILTALGDTINITARLEALTKKYSAQLIVSEAVLRNAKTDYSELPRYSEQVRGRAESVEIFVVNEAATLVKQIQRTRPQQKHS